MAIPGLLKQKRGGLFGAATQSPQPAMAAPVDQKKPEFFGTGGVGRAIAGNIGDFLLQYAGMNPIYAPAMQEQRAMAYGQQQADMQRRQGLEDWVAKEQWKRDNPAPVNNDTINDFNWFKGLSPEDRAIYQQMRPEYRQGPDGRFYRIDIAPQTPTFTEDDWNKASPQGGQSAAPAGTFR